MDERGTTLIEALVAIALLGIIATASFGLILAGFDAASSAQGLEQASFLAQRLSEQLKADPNCDAIPRSRPPEQVDPTNFPGFTWQLDTEARGPGLLQATVTVSWSEHGRQRQVSLPTYLRSRSEEHR